MSPPVRLHHDHSRWTEALRRREREDPVRDRAATPTTASPTSPALLRDAARVRPTRDTADTARMRSLTDPAALHLRNRLERGDGLSDRVRDAAARARGDLREGAPEGIRRPRRVEVEDIAGRIADAVGGSSGGGKMPVPGPSRPGVEPKPGSVPDPKPDPSLRTERPAGEPFERIPADELARVQAEVDAGGDRSDLDQVDNFRQTLPPDQQAEYDRQLDELRRDDRIEFEYADDAPQSDATEDLALRGMLAATWGNPDSLERTIATSNEQSGALKITVYDRPVPIGDFHPGNPDTAAGLATPQGGIAIDRNFMNDAVATGDNPFVHEFSHIQQRTNPDGTPHNDQRYPADFPYPDELTAEYESPEVQQFIIDRFYGGTPPTDDDGNPIIANGNAETWPTLQNLFRQFPEELKEKSPAIYQQMVDYSGYDPIARAESPRVQLNGTGDAQAATGALGADFDHFSGGDDRISRGDIENVLHDPTSTAEQRAAAAFYLSNPTFFSALDVGAGRGGNDGRISLNDVTGFQRTMDEAGWSGATDGVTGTVNSRDEAKAVIERYSALADTAAGRGGRDGNISTNDLRALVDAPGIPEELRAAARYILEHR